MNYLVDANVLSEATKPKPAKRVLNWLRTNESHLAVDPIILGEIRFGIVLLPLGSKREQLEIWFSQGVQKIRCLPWHQDTGLRWAQLLSDLRVAGRSMPIKDSLVAATALQFGLTVATRNVSDFEKAGISVVDPFNQG